MRFPGILKVIFWKKNILSLGWK